MKIVNSSKKLTKLSFLTWCLISLTCSVYAQNNQSGSIANHQKAIAITNSIATEADYVPIEAENQTAKDAIVKSRTHTKGALTLLSGDIINGDFRFDYRQTKEGLIVDMPSGIKDMDKDKMIWSFSQNAKGKNKTQTYRAKDVVSFYINDMEIYDVIKYKPSFLETVAAGGGAVGLGSIGSLVGATKTQKFVLRVYKTDKVGLYHSNGLYIININGTEDAVVGRYFTSKDFAKFAAKYPAVVEKATQNEYDGENIEKYIRFVDDLTESL